MRTPAVAKGIYSPALLPGHAGDARKAVSYHSPERPEHPRDGSAGEAWPAVFAPTPRKTSHPGRIRVAQSLRTVSEHRDTIPRHGMECIHFSLDNRK